MPGTIANFSDDAKALICGANFAHLATLISDGSPQADLEYCVPGIGCKPFGLP
jgi:hypothetical protein